MEDSDPVDGQQQQQQQTQQRVAVAPCVNPRALFAALSVVAHAAHGGTAPADVIRTLAKLSTASRASARIARACVRLALRSLLPAALRSVRHSTPAAGEAALPAIRWLAATAGPAALAKVAPAVVLIAPLPSSIVAALLDVGLRPSQADLVAAARKHTPRIDLYVRSHLAGLPALTEEMITLQPSLPLGLKVVKKHLRYVMPDDLSDLLVLTFALPSSYAAHKLLDFVLAGDASALQQLQDSQNAAARQLASAHARAMAAAKRRLQKCQAPARKKQQPQPASAATRASRDCRRLQQEQEQEQQEQSEKHQQQRQELLQRHARLRDVLRQTELLQELLLFNHPTLVMRLLELREACSVDAVTVQALCQAAVCSAAGSARLPMLDALVALPAASQLPPAAADSLLQLAVTSRAPAAVSGCSKLPSIMPSAAVAAAAAALHTTSYGLLEQVCLLPAMQDVTPEQLASLLRLALRMRNAVAVQLLCSPDTCPVGHGLGAGELEELLHTALTCGMLDRTVTELCGLLAARQLPAASMASLLLTAVHKEAPFDCMQALLGLPAAQHLPSGATLQLLQAFLTGVAREEDLWDGDEAGLEQLQLLCGTCGPALSSTDSLRLLEVALSQPHLDYAGVTEDGAVRVLCEDAWACLRALPGVQALTAQALQPLMQRAVALERCSMLDMASQLPAVQAMMGQDLEALLRAAIMTPNNMCLRVLVSTFQGVHDLQPAAVAGLLELAMQVDRDGSRSRSGIDGKVCAVTLLCCLRGAQQLQGREVAALLDTAARLADCRPEDAPPGAPPGAAAARTPRVVRALAGLPGAARMPAADAAALLHVCAEQTSGSALRAAVDHLPAMAALDEAAVLGVLQAQRLRPRHDGTLVLLHKRLLQELLELVRTLRAA